MKRSLLLIGFVLNALAPAACQDELHNYGECKRIEFARCELRARCDASFDLDTCEAYYEEYCRTREIDPPEVDGNSVATTVNACVAALGALTCEQFTTYLEASDYGDETDTLEGCEFLWPQQEEDTDADTDGDDDDGGTTDAG